MHGPFVKHEGTGVKTGAASCTKHSLGVIGVHHVPHHAFVVLHRSSISNRKRIIIEKKHSDTEEAD
jgi:hypothetical protein